MSGAITFSGLATSMDTKAIVSELMVLAREPETVLENQKAVFQSQVDVYDQLQSALTNLQGIATGMSSAATFSATTATSADSSIATVTSTGAAVNGTHSLVVNQLATSQRQVSATGYASASDLNFNTGSITITDDQGDAPITVNIGAGSNSLNGIAAALNSSGANLSATVINDGSSSDPYMLMVSGLDDKNYTIDCSGLTSSPTAANGTAYTNPSFPQSGATYVGATAASYTLDGINMTSSSNTVSNALPGVTFNLLQGGGASTSFTINNNVSGVTANINSFISSYNTAIGLIQQQNNFNSTTNSAGPLAGDSTLMNIQTDLQNILSTPVADSNGTYTIASEIGITTQEDGSLSVDSTQLSAALSSNFSGVVNLFTQNGNPVSTAQNLSLTPNLPTNQYGIFGQFDQELSQLTAPYIGASYSGNGIVATQINSLQGEMTGIDNQVAQMEILMTQKENTLDAQFTAMETLVSSLQTQGSALTEAMSSMSSSSSSSS